MSELKPCPFCGQPAVMDNWWRSESGTVYYVKCEGYVKGTGCRVSTGAYATREEAAGNWNTRPIEDALQAEIDRLKAERRWIPVSERLPEKRGAYYVYLSDDFGFRPDMDFFENGDWNSYTVGDVTHWMPPPAEPPSEEEC